MKTRATSKKLATRKRAYRKRVKTSKCRGKGPAACRGTNILLKVKKEVSVENHIMLN
jgi:hypothetical protein